MRIPRAAPFGNASEVAVGRILLGLLRLSPLKAGILLVYHRIEERTGDPEQELVPAHGLELFRAQLRHLSGCYRTVRACDLLSSAAERRRGERFPVAVTFDDDLASHKLRAAPALAELGIPATFFLTGASLEGPSSAWWERLQRAADLGLELPVVGAGLHESAAAIEAMEPEERARVAADLGQLVGSDEADAGLRPDDVADLTAGGFELGFHTRGHDRLVELEDEVLARALREGREQLEAIAGGPITAIAYPHGKADERVATAAREAGFRRGFTGSYERVSAGSDPLLLGRIEPTFKPGGAFALQLVRVLTRAQR